MIMMMMTIMHTLSYSAETFKPGVKIEQSTSNTPRENKNAHSHSPTKM